MTGGPLERAAACWPDDMDPADLKRLMDWAARAPIREIEVVEGDTRIHLVKAGPGVPIPAARAASEPHHNSISVVAAPLAGLFHLQASPQAAPFVAVGQRIRAGDTVGLIEAMKMFNEVASEFDGIVEAVLVESGREVAFGQPLVRLGRDPEAST